MSTGSTSAYVGACRKDIPYPSVSNESVPSLIDNLVTALYGEITKTVVNRRVQWNIPCDPANAPATVFGIPRNDGEGLLCYFIRAFNAANSGGGTFNGSFIGPLTGNASTATTLQTARNISITGAATAPAVAFNGSTNISLNTSIANLPDSSLATISTAGKVSNSATTATSNNTANTIVARNASGNFSVGAITGSLLGNATSATNIAGGVLNSIPYQTSANTTGLLPAGTNGQVLGILSGVLQWVSAPAAATASALAGGSAGQVPWQTGSNATGFTAAGTTGQVLTSNGTSVPTWSTNIGGNAGTATTLATARTIALSGDVTGTATSFNGSANISIPVTINAGSVVPADLSTGGPTWDASGNLTATSFVGNITGSITGNAATATRLATPRTIGLSGDVTGTASFDGSANATIAATVPNNSVTAAKLGTNEKLGLCKAFVNFDGTLISAVLSNMGAGQNISVTVGSNIATFTNNGSWPANYVGTIFYIPSIGGVSGATLGGVNVSTIGVQFISLSGSVATVKLLAGNATSSQTVNGNGTSTGWTYVNGGIRSSYNVSSITKLGVGDYQISFQTPMADANYAVCGSSGTPAGQSGSWIANGSDGRNANTTTSTRVQNNYNGSATNDANFASVVIFGN